MFGSQFVTNVRNVFDSIDFFGSMLNTLIVACSVTVAGAVLRLAGRVRLRQVRVPRPQAALRRAAGTFMVPVQLEAIPQFVIMAKLGWIGTIKALIVPAAANAFGIFWMRQYIKGAVPDELLDAARLDGAGFFRQYWHVALPVVRPGLAFLGIFTFMGQWNDYPWPLIVLTNPEKVTLQVALSQLNGVHGTTDYGRVMTGALLALIPLLVVFASAPSRSSRDLGKGAIR